MGRGAHAFYAGWFANSACNTALVSSRHLHLAARSACASFSPVECSSSDSCGRLKLWGCSDPCFRGVLQPDCECPRYVRRKLGHAQRYRRSRHGDACAGKVFWVASCLRVVCVLLSLSFRLCLRLYFSDTSLLAGPRQGNGISTQSFSRRSNRDGRAAVPHAPLRSPRQLNGRRAQCNFVRLKR